ncbi:MAG: DEAD/DEAH box helicase family protein, partial [Clostridia bacterium]
MQNFTFLNNITEYKLFAHSAIEAENVFESSPAMCAFGCRKALELAVKWVYSADNTMVMPYKDILQALVHEPSFRFAVDKDTWGKFQFIIKLGNLAVHTEKQVSKSDALLSLSALFEFVQWIDYCYGNEYIERSFDENLISKIKVEIDTVKIKELELLTEQKDEEIKKLRLAIEKQSKQFMENKETEMPTRQFVADDISEFMTRKIYIDVDLKLLGWVIGDDCIEEDEYTDMMGIDGQKGRADYVLFGKDGLPLAVVEAKRTSKDPIIGKKQAVLYADCLERKYGRRPMMFVTNGFETYFWDDTQAPMRPVSGIFSKDDLQKLMDRRTAKKDLSFIKINDDITDRYYQKEAIRACSEHFETGHRRALLVMATGSGKTRTASSFTDILSRGGHITNVLFLADRTALVKQAKDDFRIYLPEMSLCNLLSNKDDKNSRIVFSTYPTILNAIDSVKNKDGKTLFTPAHFDLIIIDEAHRSIFKKYRAIFEYFDSLLVGLTATPKLDVDRNTYEFFEVEHNVPTYAYDYDTAKDKDKVLVPYYNIEVKTKFLEEGITYDDLSEEDKKRYEEDFAEDDGLPEFIPSGALNKFIFNQNTVDSVLVDLMTNGIKIESGDKIGKTIIFAQTKDHAQYIVERFDKLYPQYKGKFMSRVVCDDSYAQTIIDDFKVPDKMPQVVVSVDMMDTGIDVPQVLNLVFFKKIRSKTKFWQMIGRGTRLCKDLECMDSLDGEYTDKRRFYIFDYCGNFAYFREEANGIEGNETYTLSENIFIKQVKLISALQAECFVDCVNLRVSLVDTVHNQILELNMELTPVKLKRKHIEKYKNKLVFNHLAELDKPDLMKHIAPLVYNNETDEHAKKFDNFMYGLMLSSIESTSTFKKLKKQLCAISDTLLTKTTIPQVKEKIETIKSINTDEFWSDASVREFEAIRVALRDLIKFIIEPVTLLLF